MRGIPARIAIRACPVVDGLLTPVNTNVIPGLCIFRQKMDHALSSASTHWNAHVELRSSLLFETYFQARTLSSPPS